MVSHHKKLDEQVISSATRDYSLILCLDPVMFAKALHRVNLPVMAVATPKEVKKFYVMYDALGVLFSDHLDIRDL
mgnify:CR=1 FL=1